MLALRHSERGGALQLLMTRVGVRETVLATGVLCDMGEILASSPKFLLFEGRRPQSRGESPSKNVHIQVAYHTGPGGKKARRGNPTQSREDGRRLMRAE